MFNFENKSLLLSSADDCFAAVPTSTTAANPDQPRKPESKISEETSTGMTLLHLKGCSVTDAGLRHLFAPASVCRSSLVSLDVSKCPGVTQKTLCTLPPISVLTSLRADNCRGLTSFTLSLPIEHPLQDLSLRTCPSLKALDLDAKQLAVSSFPVLLFSRLSYIFIVYVDPEKMFLDHKKKDFWG